MLGVEPRNCNRFTSLVPGADTHPEMQVTGNGLVTGVPPTLEIFTFGLVVCAFAKTVPKISSSRIITAAFHSRPLSHFWDECRSALSR